MDLMAWLRKQLEVAEPDLLREMVKSFAEALMGAEAERPLLRCLPRALGRVREPP